MPPTHTPKRTQVNGDRLASGGSKRARRGASPFESRESGLAKALSTNGFAKHSKSAPTEHQAGAIRRIQLKNFVTYTTVEFFPGPSLNMVIGPNGTGKSTLVCAICIGLGYDPKYLGRAKDVSEFVKHGASEAHIEIELQRPAGWERAHPVIRCVIKREGNRTSYSIDKKPMSAKDIKKRVAKLGVQIDNLCQFLPQDRVAEFANMTPVELLRSTQRAVASQQMLDWHDQLKTTRKSQRDVEAEQHELKSHLANLEAKHRMQEADVQRIRERDEVLARIEHLERSKPFLKYRSAKAAVTETGESFKKLSEEIRGLEGSVEPFLREAKVKERYKNAIIAARDDRKTTLDTCATELDDREQQFKGIDRKSDLNKQKAVTEQKAISIVAKDVARINALLRDLRRQAEQPPPVSQEALNTVVQNIQKCKAEKRRIDDTKEEYVQQRRKLYGDKALREKQIQDSQQKIRDLETKAGQQSNKLRSLNQDTWKAWQWIQKNQNRFEKQVFGPAMIECSVKDMRYVDMVESMVNRNDMLSLTVQTQQDYITLQRSLRELGLSRVNQRQMPVGLDRYQPPLGREDLRSHGFDGWLVDLLEGPEIVLASLCEGSKIHTAGYALREHSDQQFETLKASNFNQWVTPKASYKIQRRREFGPSATSVTVRELAKARMWTNEPVNLTEKLEQERRISELTDDIKTIESEIDILSRDKTANLNTRLEQLDNEIKDLTGERDQMLNAISRHKGLPTRITAQEEELSHAQEQIDAWKERSRQIQREEDELILKKGEIAIEHADMVERLRKAQDDLQDAEIMLIEAKSDVETLAERNASVTQELESKMTQRAGAKKRLDDMTKEARELGREIKGLVAGYDDDTRERLREIQQRIQSVDDLNAELESDNARLSLMQEDSGGTLVQYERREKEIEQIRRKLEEVEGALEEFASLIKQIRDQWEPQLDSLIERISYSFSYNMLQINCAGEVGIYKDEEDFDQWSVQIKVKFREHEGLSQLDSHRQSGGERAVSTIFYLMSLQSLTKSPFRVVDEINQGMDPRNERLVHARMVAIATGMDDMPVQQIRIPTRRNDEEDDEGDDEAPNGHADDDDDDDDRDELPEAYETQKEGVIAGQQKGSQYFLITPKLLPDLKYERGMRVLCIGSGEHMPPSESNMVDFRKALEIRQSMTLTAA